MDPAAGGFVPITALFYSVFHPHEGTKVIHQVPDGAVVPATSEKLATLDEPLFDFDVIKNYVIPKPNLCNKLVNFKIGSHRVIGFPVNIYAPHYARNSFNFNFCFVFPYDSDATPYEGNIKRIGRMFRALEEQSQLLSKSLTDSQIYFNEKVSIDSMNNIIEVDNLDFNNKYFKVVQDWDNDQVVLDKMAPGRDNVHEPKLSSIQSLIEQIYQDLNNYSECMIPIDIANSVDLKLFSISPPPPPLHSFDVPLALVKLESMIDSLWDPTMLKIVPFINGTNSIGLISELANSDYHLTKQCIQHLCHYQAVTILDIFQFSNRYAVTNNIGELIKSEDMGFECQEFVVSSVGSFDNLPLKTPNRPSDTYSLNSTQKQDYLMSQSSAHRRQNRPTPFSQHHMNSASTANILNQQQSATKKLVLPSRALLFSLYCSLNQNLTLKQWVLSNAKDLVNIDVRKFIMFGCIKGIIYRVRSYPMIPKLATEIEADVDLDELPIGQSLNAITEYEDDIQYEDVKKQREEQLMEMKLRKLVRKCSNMDSICTTLRTSTKNTCAMLDKFGDWDNVHC